MLYRGLTSVGLVFWGVPCLGLVSGSFRDSLAKLSRRGFAHAYVLTSLR